MHVHQQFDITDTMCMVLDLNQLPIQCFKKKTWQRQNGPNVVKQGWRVLVLVGKETWPNCIFVVKAAGHMTLYLWACVTSTRIWKAVIGGCGAVHVLLQVFITFPLPMSESTHEGQPHCLLNLFLDSPSLTTDFLARTDCSHPCYHRSE